ncbi:MAG: CoA-binding protein [Chloroflexi bacterium]|nr:CoA-binding protein [Chloroflexota bacterium]
MNSDEQLRAILTNYRNVAVVGLSPNPDRPGNEVARYLLANGYNVIPVNPGVDEVLGLRSYPTLEDVPEPIEIVDVFRRSEYVPDIARSAAGIGAKVLWTQLGVISAEGAEIAASAGLQVVMDRCALIEHRRLAVRTVRKSERP